MGEENLQIINWNTVFINHYQPVKREAYMYKAAE